MRVYQFDITAELDFGFDIRIIFPFAEHFCYRECDISTSGTQTHYYLDILKTIAGVGLAIHDRLAAHLADIYFMHRMNLSASKHQQ